MKRPHPLLPPARQAGLLSLLALALSLPFELEAPWLVVGPLQLTNVELLQTAVLGLAAIVWLRAGEARRALQRVPPWWLALLSLFLLATFLSAFLAPALRGNALKAALRTSGGVTLALAVPVLVRSRRERLYLFAALVGGGLAAASLGMGEALMRTDFAWLQPVRATPTVAGPFLRLSGPFDYANQAAMYIEATLPLLAAFAVLAWRQERRGPAALLAGATWFYAQAAILTFSRAGFATMVVVYGCAALLLWRPRLRGQQREGYRTVAPLFAALGLGIAVLIAANAALNPVFRLRFGSESDNAWYQARFAVPAALQMEAGEQQAVDVTVGNEGAFTWRSEGAIPIKLAARWLLPDSGSELQEQPRWLLARPVAPGEQVTMHITVRAPQQAGDYELFWDMVQEDVVWFGAKTGRRASTDVTVHGTPHQEAARVSSQEVEKAWQFAAPIPGRRTLWQVAWQLWQERPLLGIGPDNFRLRYGEALGYSLWNDSIHSNNWYVETVVSLGLAGALPFFLWLSLLGRRLVGSARREPQSLWPMALAAGLFTYVVHGLLDYFLLFNATALLFWILAGLWLASAYDGPDGAD